MKDCLKILLLTFVLLLLLHPGSSRAQDTLKFAWITDLHFGKPNHEGEILTPDIWVRQSLHGISSSGASFIFVGGDIIESSNNAAQYALFDSAMKTTLPWYPMPGNHDIGTDSTSIRMDKIDAWIGRGYGRGAYNREFYGLAVDSLAAFFVLNTQAPVSNDPAVLARADQQLAEMDSFFTAHASARQKFVCSHVPLFIQTRTEADAYFNIATAYRNRILALMDKHGVRTYLAGHRHENGIARNGGITVFSNTALSFQLGTGNQRGYYVYSVTPDTVLRNFSPPVPAGSYGLDVKVQGSGRVTIIPDLPYFPSGSFVQLAAIPDSGWRFLEWRGDISGTDSALTLAVDTTKSIQAVFEEKIKSYNLHLRGTQPGGTITADPAGGRYAEGTEVTVEAVAEEGWEFAGWTGALQGAANPDTVVMAGPQEVKARFRKLGSTRTVLSPVEDSYVRGSLYSSRNFDSDSLLRVREGGADLYRCRSFLKFDLSTLTGTVVQATLLVRSRLTNSFPDGTPVNVHACRTAGENDSWTETALTWKNAPTEGEAADSAMYLAGVNSLYSWDLTDPLTEERTGDKVLTVMLKDKTMQDKTVDFDAREKATGPVLEVETTGPDGVEESAAAPRAYRLEQNYPNPFNPKTVVSSRLPVASEVRLVIYDVLGREVAVLVDERRGAGIYHDTFDGTGLGTGVYIYRMIAGAFVESRQMILIK